MLKQFEYKVVSIKSKARPSDEGGTEDLQRYEHTLNASGSEGWELVSIVSSLSLTLRFLAFFKREKID